MDSIPAPQSEEALRAENSELIRLNESIDQLLIRLHELGLDQLYDNFIFVREAMVSASSSGNLITKLVSDLQELERQLRVHAEETIEGMQQRLSELILRKTNN